MSKTHVFIVGASGHTGGAIAKALLEAGNFRLSILVRQTSINKAGIKELTDTGAEVVIGDITESPEKLQSYLKGVDVLISTVLLMVDQKPLMLAAKKAGVRRVIPSDFGPTAPKGVMDLHDLKLGIRDYIKELGLPHTFVEVGWWLSGLFPPLHSARNTLMTQKVYVGDRSQKLIYSTLPTIGKMVARIIVDPRTLNQTVVAYDGEISINETWKVAAKVTGEDFSDYPKVSDEEIERGRQRTDNWAKKAIADYYRSLFIRGDNTLAKAEALGRLDSRKLYDDIPYPDVEEEAKNHYALGFVLDYSLSEEHLLDVFKTGA
ncbi:NAD-P-binding protein [Pleurotus eryngii]|uniref:NAD-P-binding protein n=1 Tax=Pleurotus eryngii TaxID=5323 RepID=A0A9P5ZP38_PLEER|nr:NAD-P-binding protein [Pleurotus eryngii]